MSTRDRSRHLRRRPHAVHASTSGEHLLLRSVGFEPARFSAREQDVLLAAHGPVRRAQLQRGRARPARHRQVAPVPAGLAVRAPDLGRQGDGRPHVRQQRHRPARTRRPVRRRLLRRGVRRLLRPEGRRQHHEGLHGVRRVQPWQGEHPRRRRHRAWSATSTSTSPTQQRVGHLFGPLPKEMRNDTAFMDRIHAYLPGWDVPKLDPSYFTDHFGFVSDFLAECWSQLRRTVAARRHPRAARLGEPAQRPRSQGREQHRQRASQAALARPRAWRCPTTTLAWAAELALEMRRRVKEQQAFIGAAEFGKVDLSYRVDGGPEKVVYCDESVRHRLRMESEDARSRRSGETGGRRGPAGTGSEGCLVARPGP